jgi:hypothetical protein
MARIALAIAGAVGALPSWLEANSGGSRNAANDENRTG